MPKILIGNVVGPAGADGIGIKNITFKEEQADGNVYTITLTDDSTYDVKAPKGAQGPTGAKGEDGQAGEAGPQGVGVQSITFKETNEDGGNVYTITLTNQNTYEFTAPRGQQGIPGQKGDPGTTDWNTLNNKPEIYTKTETNNLLADKLGKEEKAKTAGTADSASACTGNSATATKLKTARNINGVAYDGTSDITIVDDTKLPKSGGTINGNLTVTGAIVSNSDISAGGSVTAKTIIINGWTMAITD